VKAELQRRLIFEACGYSSDTDGALYWIHGHPPPFDTEQDPLNDLNAMHEAERWMHQDGNRGYEYDMALCNVVQAYEGVGLPCNHMRLYHATAAQRAEAFLRTLGKWVDP